MTALIKIGAVSMGGQNQLSFDVPGNSYPAMIFTVSPDRTPLAEFNNMISDPATDTVLVTGAGRALETDLRQHPNWPPSLGTLLQTNGGGRRIDIEIPPIAKAAHNYPWEALYNQPAGGFLAPDANIAVVRMVPPASGRRRDVAVYSGPLRIFAIIAAANVNGAAEWAALNHALQQWTGPIDCRVLVHDPQLQATIAAQNPGVTCALVPSDAATLISLIAQFEPHIFHVFCHGLAGDTPRLEIAIPGSDLGAPPLHLSGLQLAQALGSAWLAILNACSSGAVAPESSANSVASDLVEQGVTFAISMRQEVETNVANCFTESFLGHLLGELVQFLPQGQVAKMEPEVAMARARASIIQLFGGAPAISRTKEWTLPILLAGVSSFEIKPPSFDLPDQPNLIVLVSELTQLREALRAGEWNDAQRARIEGRINELEGKLGA